MERALVRQVREESRVREREACSIGFAVLSSDRGAGSGRFLPALLARATAFGLLTGQGLVEVHPIFLGKQLHAFSTLDAVGVLHAHEVRDVLLAVLAVLVVAVVVAGVHRGFLVR